MAGQTENRVHSSAVWQSRNPATTFSALTTVRQCHQFVSDSAILLSCRRPRSFVLLRPAGRPNIFHLIILQFIFRFWILEILRARARQLFETSGPFRFLFLFCLLLMGYRQLFMWLQHVLLTTRITCIFLSIQFAFTGTNDQWHSQTTLLSIHNE